MAKKTLPTADTTAAPSSSSILDGMGDLSSLLDAPAATGKPLELALEQIDEDPDQPRREFDEADMKEMASSIAGRGVRTPISVRPHPTDAGRYVINFGARRYRASKMAGRATIPAYIDPDANRADQVIENLQRVGLSARELADFIGGQLKEGRSKKEVADLLHKSPAFVSQHVALLDLPEPIAAVFHNGRCGDVSVINDLVRAYKKAPEKVTDWLANESQDITRRSVAVLREYLDTKADAKATAERDTKAGSAAVTQGETREEAPEAKAGKSTEQGQEDDGQFPMFDDEGKGAAPEAENPTPPAPITVPPAPPAKERDIEDHDPDKFKKAIVCVSHNERPARLVLTRRPSTAGLGWIKYDDDGAEVEVALDLIVVTHLVEG